MIVSKAYEERRLRLVANSCIGETVLDIGYAQNPNPYLDNFHRVGFDLQKPTDSGIAYEECLLGDVNNILELIGERRFDTIVCGELIEHVENPYSLLRDLHNLLNKKGRLIVTTPNPLGFPNVLLEVTSNKRFFYTEEHLYYFLPRWVERLLEHSGYRLHSKKGVGIWFPWFVIPFPLSVVSYQIVYVCEPIS